MSVFARPFLFLRAPDGGVENLADMKAAGFEGVFCNVGDYPVEAWERIVLPRARSLGMFCGPWARTAKGEPAKWDPAKLSLVVAVADRWGSPLVVNSEKEIDHSGATRTKEIAAAVGTRDAAVSVEQMPFGDVDWTPVAHLPMLPQVFPAETGRGETTEQTRQAWWNAGVTCVYMTFGTYTGKFGTPIPSWYVLRAPYSLYTGDDCGSNYARWSPTSSVYVACKEDPMPPIPSPTDPVPAGAYDDVARLLTDNVKRPDGKDATAFNSQRDSLKATRTAVNDHEKRIAAIEKKLGL